MTCTCYACQQIKQSKSKYLQPSDLVVGQVYELYQEGFGKWATITLTAEDLDEIISEEDHRPRIIRSPTPLPHTAS